MSSITNRFDIVYFFDVTNGNPNGDPDAGNQPRTDPETNIGLVSDVCLKRKIRNYIELVRGDQPGYRIYVQDGAILNEKHREAYKGVWKANGSVDTAKKLNPRDDADARALTKFMCENFADVRYFGAVMSTNINAGQVRGPVQVAFAKSVEPIMPLEIAITRMAATNEKEKAERDQSAEDDERKENRTMGRKSIVPYALYRVHIFINAKLAERTGFSESDLQLVFEALRAMFEHDHSAARGEMTARGAIAFKHTSALGNAPAHVLFDRVTVQRRWSNGDASNGVYAIGDKRLDNAPPARRYEDYKVSVDRDNLPEGIEIMDLL
jgi:CRISPR-associated protein Csd2